MRTQAAPLTWHVHGSCVISRPSTISQALLAAFQAFDSFYLV